MKKVLVSGATGYIASRLIPELLRQFSVFATVRGLTTPKSKGISYIETDLSRQGWTKSLPGGIDYVFHFANSNEYKNFPEGAQDIFKVNIQATFELLEWSRRSPVEKFIYASTGSI